MPFSRASACMASRISRDISGPPLLLDEVRTTDLRVGDRDDAPVGGEGDLAVGSSHELSGEALGALGGRRPIGIGRPRSPYRSGARAHSPEGWVPGGWVGQHACAATDEAAEVVGLGQGTFAARRGDLERVALANIREPVSYTHLRAHETRHDLVCRLLLEK